MAGLDSILAGARTWVESNLLVDTVRITAAAVGQPVLNESTGLLEYPEGDVIYEGPGAVLGTGQTELSATPDVLQSWTTETKSRYQLLTPLTAPMAPKDALVTVVQVHNPANAALIGRVWICQDPARVSTVEVVRKTPLDQNQVRQGTTS